MVRKKPKIKDNTQRKKKNRAKRIFLTILTVLLLSLISLGVYFFNIFSKYDLDKDFDKANEDLGITQEAANMAKKADIINIAVFGVDQRFTESSRSDSIVVLSIDNEHKKVKLSSIMRDSYVTIEGHGKDKINHAYAYGGAQLAVKTLNQNFGLDIRDYATINFSQLAEIVDAVGGVTIDVKSYEIESLNGEIDKQTEWINKKKVLVTKSGRQVLNGIQALAYARIRHVGNGDYERTDRQRDILRSLFDKMLGTNIIKYPEISRKILPYMKTSIPADTLLKYGYTIANGSYKLEEMRMPTEDILEKAGGGGKMINGVYYLAYDIESAKNAFQKYLYDDVIPE